MQQCELAYSRSEHVASLLKVLMAMAVVPVVLASVGAPPGVLIGTSLVALGLGVPELLTADPRDLFDDGHEFSAPIMYPLALAGVAVTLIALPIWIF